MALKLLRRGLATAPEATARLIQEAMLAGQVPHPAIVQVFDCAALADGQVYLAMELLRGESLEQRAASAGSRGEVVPLLAELARGLAAVHRVGVVHRDIKPANMFLASGDSGVQAKLLDFGVAKLLPGATERRRRCARRRGRCWGRRTTWRRSRRAAGASTGAPTCTRWG
jgi:serine/threonine protein kinase